jgi:hypothetical protein
VFSVDTRVGFRLDAGVWRYAVSSPLDLDGQIWWWLWGSAVALLRGGWGASSGSYNKVAAGLSMYGWLLIFKFLVLACSRLLAGIRPS